MFLRDLVGAHVLHSSLVVSCAFVNDASTWENRMQGWTNKLLEINLKAQITKTANIKNQVLESYVGEKGLGVCLSTRGVPSKRHL